MIGTNSRPALKNLPLAVPSLPTEWGAVLGSAGSQSHGGKEAGSLNHCVEDRLSNRHTELCSQEMNSSVKLLKSGGCYSC